MNSNNSSRSASFKSTSYYHRKNISSKLNNKRRRPETWTCRLYSQQPIVSPRVSRWSSQHYKQQSLLKRASSSSSGVTKFRNSQQQSYFRRQMSSCINRQTIATISTLTSSNTSHSVSVIDVTATGSDDQTMSRQATCQHKAGSSYYVNYEPEMIFHVQSTLFLFGFLFFPCWWFGSFYFDRSEYVILSGDEEKHEQQTHQQKTLVVVHPSLLANGKTSSKLFQTNSTPTYHSCPYYFTRMWFYECNYIMSLISIGLIACFAGLLIWFYVEC